MAITTEKATVASTTSILVADDHAMVREMLAHRLQSVPDFSVVAVACDGTEVVDLAIRHKPDLILTDIDMPGQTAFAAARAVHLQLPDTRFIYLSAFAHDHYIESALAAHASGYITKDEPTRVVIDAIHAVASGSAYFSPRVQSRILIDTHSVRLTNPIHSRAARLTDRELEILRYVARGMAKKSIAETLHISAKTVDRHVSNLMMRLDIHDRVELSRYAIREGICEP